MITGKTPAAEAPKTLGDLRLLSGVAKFPQRIKCATLGWHALKGRFGSKPRLTVSSVSIIMTAPTFKEALLLIFHESFVSG